MTLLHLLCNIVSDWYSN